MTFQLPTKKEEYALILSTEEPTLEGVAKILGGTFHQNFSYKAVHEENLRNQFLVRQYDYVVPQLPVMTQVGSLTPTIIFCPNLHNCPEFLKN